MSPDGSVNPSPEEKLLKLIRGSGGRGEVGAASSSGAGPTSAAPSDVVVWSGAPGRAPTIRWVGLALGGLSLVVFAEVVLLIVHVARPASELRVSAGQAGASAVERPRVATTPTTAPPQEIPSLAMSASRPLFTSSADAASSDAPRAQQSPSGKQLAAHLTLMGIVAGNPGQAIIEDDQTKKTYFVTVGQAVAEGAVVEQVLDHHVILDLDGEKIDLTL